MNHDMGHVAVLRDLLLGRGVAALATLHEGRPFASMVPFAATTVGGRIRLVVHVSGLASHPRDMRAHADVCLLITAAESAGVPPQALPRVSIPAVAEFLSPAAPEHAALKGAYLEKFPDAAPLFGFADFALVALVPRSVRLVAGFARALTLAPETLLESLAQAGDAT